MFCRQLIVLPAVVVLGLAVATGARAQSAIVEGTARAEDDGAPIAFALVRLVSADTTASLSATSPKGITSADGRYRFTVVPAGRYRVQLLRIGFRPALSDPVQVADGETVQLPLRVAWQPLQLPEMTVTAAACVTSGSFAAHPQLQTLWQQARDGASIREGLMARYRYTTVSREVGFEHTASGPTPPHTLERPIISDPKWALRNASRSREERLSRGYYGPNDGWYLPNELHVLHEDFASTHCFEATPVRDDGAVGMRFRPVQTRRNFLDTRGTIWLDSITYLAVRIELEYVDGDDSRGTVQLDFADVSVAGGTLRMPVGGAYMMRPSRKNPGRRTEGTLTFTYSGFEEVPQR